MDLPELKWTEDSKTYPWSQYRTEYQGRKFLLQEDCFGEWTGFETAERRFILKFKGMDLENGKNFIAHLLRVDRIFKKDSKEISPEQNERLVYLAEECAEVLHAVTKILRHGFLTHNPRDEGSITNRCHLQEELSNFAMAVQLMTKAGDIMPVQWDEAWERFLKTKTQWFYHQDRIFSEEK